MFRTKRSLLVRRLWRSRAPGGGEEETGDGGAPAEPRPHSCGGGGRGCCPAKPPRGGGRGAAEGELKALTHAVLKRCKERQLEGLLRAVESRGAARTPCVLLPARGEARLGAQRDALPALLCRVFRWPELRHGAPLKRLRGCCQADGAAPTELVCCNPHHLSRLCELESPPPPYSRYPMDFLKPTAGCPDSVPSSTETGGTNCLAPGGLSDSQVLQESGDHSHWCVVAYWEEKTRVGRLYSVQEPSLDIFYDLPQGNGFCLGQLNSDNRSQLVQKVRSKIGYGIQLTKEVDGVWVYNRSSYPIFIKSATLDNPDSRTLLVHKVFPGFSIKAFDYEKAYSLQRPNDHEFMQQPWTGFTVQISFVKGWGQCYTRQFISSCPCWLEVIFNNR
ncbi:mothers against decapentaplegic homolog 7 isoform X1 [Gallus gallus]|uniref:Mothers against decapentaplegic homolog n=4 Tax=Phasianidae TaxID=9005 RepID=A0A1D5PNY8_CHICK|nr:mothers against decapentaplegic homolog 7 isoform X1 [Gallus gallus]XP_427238.2 mothers against decapentaplegic homolog 7 isoform X1 [Gallus gallus]|eukprot:XP_427238.2 mothers against decapentaplegic homolog 7 isoform X1 [Gallus gallus]